MKKTTILCAAALLVAFGCKQSENVSTTSSSETTSTVSTTDTAPVTDTSATTMTTSTATATESTPPPASATTATTSTSAKHETKKTTGPTVTETVGTSGAVSLPKNPPPPPKSPEPEKSTTTTSSSTPAASSNASLASTGQGIFKSNCTACHGADASGNTPIGKKNNIPDFRSSSVQGMSDAELSNVIANGKGPISSSAHKSKHLSSDQISALVAYIRSLK